MAPASGGLYRSSPVMLHRQIGAVRSRRSCSQENLTTIRICVTYLFRPGLRNSGNARNQRDEEKNMACFTGPPIDEDERSAPIWRVVDSQMPHRADGSIYTLRGVRTNEFSATSGAEQVASASI
jgi:hypothetical protein